MIEEIWKDIEGYEGIYQVSNLGRVRSLDRHIIKPHPKNGVPTKYFQRGRIIITHPGRNEYIKVMLKNEGTKKNFMVHRLVAKSFVSGYFEGADVNHKDCNRMNNQADNLEWVTRIENLMYHTPNNETPMEQIHKSQRKPVIQMTIDGDFIREWPSIHSVHKELRIDSKSIKGCCDGLSRYKHAGGFRWKYKE